MMANLGAGLGQPDVFGASSLKRRCCIGALALPLMVLVVLSLKACNEGYCATIAYEPPNCGDETACPCKTRDEQINIDRCVRLIGCESDLECPAGTVCLGEENDVLETEFQVCQVARDAGAKKTRCQLSRDRDSAALINGFQANEFLLEPVEGSLAFRFVPPPDAWYVACTLFGCTPNIRPSGCDLENRVVGRIVNYDRCSLSGKPQVSSIKDLAGGDVSPFVFTAQVEERVESRGPACGTQNRIQKFGGRVLTDISVGCWAYDATNVIGATQLVPLTAEQVEKLSDDLTTDCQDSTSDIAAGTCILSQSDVEGKQAPEFGSCYGKKCAHRCVTARDCPAGDPSADCLEPVASCVHMPAEGDAVLHSYLGVCHYLCDRNEIADAGDGGQP